MLSSRFLALACSCLLSLPVSAQTVTAVVQEGDVVAGVGAVTAVNNLAINDAGDWRVEVDTDNPDTQADGALLLNGALEFREGQILFGTVGVGSFDSVNVPSDVTGGWNFFLDGTTGNNDDSGIFHGGNLLIQEGQATIAPSLDPTGIYIGWLETKAIPGTILMMSSLDDPSIIGAGSVDRALVKANHDGAGVLLSEEVVAKEGDVPPGQTEEIVDMETGPHNFAINASGQVMYTVDLAGDAAVDHATYLDGTLLAQEGMPSPVTGFNWASLASSEVDLNDFGDYVISGSLDAPSSSNLVITRNGQKLIQEGDTLPAIAPFTLTSFGSGPVLITNQGDVLWYGDWNDPDTTRDTGLFLNDELIVQEGVSTIGGAAITALRGIQDGYTISKNGKWILFECALGSDDVAARINRGGFNEFPSCVENVVSLAHTAGVPAVGESFTLSLDNGLQPLSVPFLAVSNAPVPAPPPCGFTLPQGELMIALAPPNPIILEPGPFWSPGTPADITLSIPNTPSLAGAMYWSQGAMFHPGTTPTIVLSNALVVELGE